MKDPRIHKHNPRFEGDDPPDREGLIAPRGLKWALGGALLVLLIGYVVHRSQELDQLARFERDGGEILEAAVSWRAQHTTLGCPTISQLIQDRFLPKSAQTGGRRFRILCSADEVHIEQLGNDGKPLGDDALRLNQRVTPSQG